MLSNLLQVAYRVVNLSSSMIHLHRIKENERYMAAFFGIFKENIFSFQYVEK